MRRMRPWFELVQWMGLGFTLQEGKIHGGGHLNNFKVQQEQVNTNVSGLDNVIDEVR